MDLGRLVNGKGLRLAAERNLLNNPELSARAALVNRSGE